MAVSLGGHVVRTPLLYCCTSDSGTKPCVASARSRIAAIQQAWHEVAL